MSLKERLRWWSRAARSRGADLKQAESRKKHFDKVGDLAHKQWVAAKHKHNAKAAAEAKAKAQRAAKKSAWWEEQADDLRDGYNKAVARRERVKKHIATRRAQASPEGFTTPEKPWNTLHRPVCGWMVPILDEAREKGWRGVVVSGVRTPAYSISLCRSMCGADSCPGRCAGATSNHNATTCAPHQGAVDVTSYYEFASIMRQMGEPLKNRLPIDRVHFSYTGN